MRNFKQLGFLFVTLVGLAQVQAGLTLLSEDENRANLTLHNGANDSSVHIPFVTRPDERGTHKKFLLKNFKFDNGRATVQLNDGSNQMYILLGNGDLSEKTFEDGPARLLMAAQPYIVQKSMEKRGGLLGWLGVPKLEQAFETETKYNVWTMTGTLLLEEDGTKFFFPDDWLPRDLSAGDDTYKLHFGLGGLDWTPLVNVGQPAHWDFARQPFGDGLYEVMFDVNNFVRQFGGAAALARELCAFEAFWGDKNLAMAPLFEGAPAPQPACTLSPEQVALLEQAHALFAQAQALGSAYPLSPEQVALLKGGRALLTQARVLGNQ